MIYPKDICPHCNSPLTFSESEIFCHNNYEEYIIYKNCIYLEQEDILFKYILETKEAFFFTLYPFYSDSQIALGIIGDDISIQDILKRIEVLIFYV